MGTLLRNLKYGLRMLASKPGFSATAVIVLALGIGANTAVFSLVNTLLLKPLLIHKPEELVGSTAAVSIIRMITGHFRTPNTPACARATRSSAA